MRKFYYHEKVLVLEGIHADEVGEIEGESSYIIRFWKSEYLVCFQYSIMEWDLQWIDQDKLQSLEEIEDNTPHPEYLKW